MDKFSVKNFVERHNLTADFLSYYPTIGKPTFATFSRFPDLGNSTIKQIKKDCRREQLCTVVPKRIFSKLIAIYYLHPACATLAKENSQANVYHCINDTVFNQRICGFFNIEPISSDAEFSETLSVAPTFRFVYNKRKENYVFVHPISINYLRDCAK